MIDAYRRNITYLRVSLTDRCNLRCTYCMPEEGIAWMPTPNLLTDDEIVRVVAITARHGLKKVRLTGGEPLIRSGLPDLVRRLCDLPGIEEVTLTTNGVLLAAQAAALYAAGLRRINISLDTLRPETFAATVRRDLFHQVWEGIVVAERVGFDPIKINVVLQQGINDTEVLDFVRLTFKTPYHIRFIEQMPCADWEMWRRVYRPFSNAREAIESTWGPLSAVVLDAESGPAEVFRLSGARGTVGFIHAISHDFCDRCNRIRLTADGKIRPCLFSEMVVDLRHALRSGADDEVIEGLLRLALTIKPEYHELDMIPQKKSLHTMVNIGG